MNKMYVDFLYDNITHRTIRVVCLNEGMSIQELYTKRGVYVMIPDAPIKYGYMALYIGCTMKELLSRTKGHFFDNFGKGGTPTDIRILRDTIDTIYIKLLVENVDSLEYGRRMESLITYQSAYDLTTLPNKESCDILHLINFNKAELSTKLYNRKVQQNLNGKPIIHGYDFKDIKEGKYSVIPDLELDLFRLGVISEKLAI